MQLKTSVKFFAQAVGDSAPNLTSQNCVIYLLMGRSHNTSHSLWGGGGGGVLQIVTWCDMLGGGSPSALRHTLNVYPRNLKKSR